VNTFITRLCAISTIAALSGCGGGNAESPRYVGNTLFIDGIAYSQAETPRHIVSGEIVVIPKEGMREEVRKLISAYQLRILREDRHSILVIVPLGYEQQWATVFGKHNAVASASASLLPTTE
jgi:hypothetical protein